jgi:developmentally-regulated GTP-binding protein 1
VLDVLKPLNDKRLIEGELEVFVIRLNKKTPSIIVRKKHKGGVSLTSAWQVISSDSKALGIGISNTVPLTNIDQDEIKPVLSEFRINNADVAIPEPNCIADDLVDVIEENRSRAL